LKAVTPIVALALAACASAATDPMANYYANTVLVTQPYGETDRLLLSADHTYVMYGVRHAEGHGQWDIESGQVCLMPQDTPETTGQKFCNTWPGRDIGDRWSIDIGGTEVPMTLTTGRLGPMQ
jgi:hypothetical protein